MIDTPAVLELRDLTIDTGPRRLLGPLTLELHAGQCLGLVGESGSGKSLSALALLSSLRKMWRSLPTSTVR